MVTVSKTTLSANKSEQQSRRIIQASFTNLFCYYLLLIHPFTSKNTGVSKWANMLLRGRIKAHYTSFTHFCPETLTAVIFTFLLYSTLYSNVKMLASNFHSDEHVTALNHQCLVNGRFLTSNTGLFAL